MKDWYRMGLQPAEGVQVKLSPYQHLILCLPLEITPPGLLPHQIAVLGVPRDASHADFPFFAVCVRHLNLEAHGRTLVSKCRSDNGKGGRGRLEEEDANNQMGESGR